VYAARRTLLTDKPKNRLERLFADDAHVEVEATWGVYQQMITAYSDPNRTQGWAVMGRLGRRRPGESIAIRRRSLLAFKTRGLVPFPVTRPLTCTFSGSGGRI
jgi:hypothetical protein